ncbi:MAG: glycosyltransferase family 2 protein [Bacteroidetes bacterium]|uniref:glycosyltransferase family 2 protein n=1 Tax=Phnomibacter sp. TaxID=2836217 RepID=UPI002FDE5F5F|nr:glycosyltransferase family 2 protein [Bacteroidota bacterium]
MQLSIIIVNYKVRLFAEQCLASLRLATKHLQAEIFVVDNNSDDGSVAYLQPLFPEVTFIAKAHNIGFACANNDALWRCKGEYVLFLNPDTIVAEDALSTSVAYMQVHPRCGGLGIQMLDGAGRFLPESKRGFPSPATSLYKQLGLYKLFPTSPRFARYYMGHLPQHTTAEVDVLAGAYMLVRKSVLDAIGGFDEKFFMYGEDIDLSYRIKQAGFYNAYFADAAIIHFKGESTAKGSMNYVRVFYQAMQLFVQKHFQGSGAFLYRSLLYLGISTRAGISAVGRILGKKLTQQEVPATVVWHAIGWPPMVAKPLFLRINEQLIPIHWKDDASDNDTALLLVAGYDVTIAQMMQLLQQHAAQKTCWLHLVQTNSVLMSNDKNKTGLSALFAEANTA